MDYNSLTDEQLKQLINQRIKINSDRQLFIEILRSDDKIKELKQLLQTVINSNYTKNLKDQKMVEPLTVPNVFMFPETILQLKPKQNIKIKITSLRAKKSLIFQIVCSGIKEFEPYSTELRDDECDVSSFVSNPALIEMLGERITYQRVYQNFNAKFLFEIIMCEISPEYIEKILCKTGFDFRDSYDVYCNLLWYLNFSKKPESQAYLILGSNRDFKKAKKFISSKGADYLLGLLGENYKNKPKDKASLLFALVSCTSTHIDPDDIPRYKIVKHYPLNIVWILAYYVYKIIDGNRVSVYPPHVYVALSKPHLIENILLLINPLNFEYVSEQYKIPLPKNYNIKQKINYLCIELAKNKDIIINNYINPIVKFSSVIIYDPPLPKVKENCKIIKFDSKLREETFEPFEVQWNDIAADLQNLNNYSHVLFLLYNHQQVIFKNKKRFLIDVLMTEMKYEQVKDILTEIFFSETYFEPDISYNLLWYINISKVKKLKYELCNIERKYICNFEEIHLLEILNNFYKLNSPKDKSSLLFALLTGCSTYIDTNNILRYEIVRHYPPNIVWILAYYLYDIIDENNKTISLYSPYAHVALKNPPHPLESLILSVNPLNVDSVSKYYNINIDKDLEIDEKINYVCIELTKLKNKF